MMVSLIAIDFLNHLTATIATRNKRQRIIALTHAQRTLPTIFNNIGSMMMMNVLGRGSFNLSNGPPVDARQVHDAIADGATPDLLLLENRVNADGTLVNFLRKSSR